MIKKIWLFILFILNCGYSFANANVLAEYYACPSPKNITAKKNISGDIEITWEGGDLNQNKWQILVLEKEAGIPNNNSPWILVEGTPKYLFQTAIDKKVYKVYVRALCSDTEKSNISTPIEFSLFTPPACADIQIEELQEEFKNGEYIVCTKDGKYNTKLNANFPVNFFKKTDKYKVEAIPFNPPFPTTGGTNMNITQDDIFSPIINLPFDFCFYEKRFKHAQVSSNGTIRLGSNHTNQNTPYAVWNLQNVNQFLTANNNEEQWTNVIMGVYQDIDPRVKNAGSTPNINYQILGTYPCRALVVSFNDVDLYDTAPPNGQRCYELYKGQTYQIVIYEITNIIEVYVYNRDSCSKHNDGKGVIGIINHNHTKGTFPPGRNIGTWTAKEEAWRFIPDGDTTVEFGWYKDNVLISPESNIIDEIDSKNNPDKQYINYEGIIKYEGCEGGNTVLQKGFKIKVGKKVNDTAPKTVSVCKLQRDIPIDLTSVLEEYFQKEEQKDRFITKIYLSLEDAQNGVNAIDYKNFVPSQYALPKIFYIGAVDSKCSDCKSFMPFKVIENNQAIIPLDDVKVCVYEDEKNIIDLKVVEASIKNHYQPTDELIISYYKNENDASSKTNPIPTPENYEYTLNEQIFVLIEKKQDGVPIEEQECESISSFRIIEGDKNPEYQFPSLRICKGYVLPALPYNHYYSTETLGKGEILAAGHLIDKLGEHTIYVNSKSADGCISTGSYKVEVRDCSIPKGISPNGDGLNDNFDLSDHHALSVKIYNRYGSEVYSHTEGYTNQWNGQGSNGSELPEGTYYYVIVTKLEVITGYIYLRREN